MSDADALPEADCADGAPHPRLTQALYGHAQAESEVLDAFTGGRRHHAWLLTGPQGIGKATLAWRMARFLLAGADAPAEAGMFGDAPPPTSLSIDPEHPVSRRVAALSDPGCTLIRRAWDPDRKKLKTQITVEEIRKLNAFFGMSATDGGNRVVIVDSADEMNTSAANALLKVLEEPPSRAILLLISHQPARLLPTIRSRCRVLRLSPLAPEDLSAAVTQAGFAVEDGTALNEIAAGSAGEAVRLIAQDGAALYGKLVKLFASAPNMDRAAARALAESVTARGAEDRLTLTLRLLDLALVRLSRTAAGHAPMHEAAPGEMDAWAKLAVAAPARDWAELQQTLSQRLGHGLGVNVDPQSLLMDAFLKVNDVARG